MSVSTTNVFNQYVSGGGADFTITFYVRSSTWLEVKVDDVVSGAWNAVLNTDQSNTPGGTITFTGTPPDAGAIIRVQRHTPILQPDVYNPYGPFPAQTVEYDFDRGVCIMQELAYALSLITIPPISNATAGMFLTNDGTIMFWEDVLPKPYVTGLFLAASSPTTLVWAAGGGGGGTNIIGALLPDAGPDGAQLTGVGANVLQLGIADVDDPGVVTIEEQSFGGLKKFPDDAALVTDIRLYGAVANDSTNDYAQAFYNATASFATRPNNYPLLVIPPNSGAIRNPRGTFYTSMPLCVPGATVFSGVSSEETMFAPGISGTGPVPTFAGPVFYHSPPYTPAQLANPAYQVNLPEYSTPLVGATGQSLVIHDRDTDISKINTGSYWLHDAWCWGTWMGNTVTLTNFCLQFWVRCDSTPAVNLIQGIIGSRGPPVWFERGAGLERADMAFGVYLISDGTHLFLQAYLTTAPDWINLFLQPSSGVTQSITSSAITHGASVHVEIDYNGVFFDFYVNGVNQGHLAASGPILRAPWEGTAIGGQGYEGLDTPPTEIEGINGAIDSIRLSNITRHTGTGSFTPPVAKYTWDANTYALYNWDQGFKTVQPVDSAAAPVGPLLTLPFLVGQTVAGTGNGGFTTPPLAGPVSHYIRLVGSSVSNDVWSSNFTINGWQGCSGLITSNAWQNKLTNVWVGNVTQFGIRIGTAVSFFNQIINCKTYWCSGIGLQFFGDCQGFEGQACGIGMFANGGCNLESFNFQPAYNCYAGQVYYGVGGVTNTMNVQGATHDAEAWTFRRQIAVAVIQSQLVASFRSQNCQWNAAASETSPVLMFGNPPFPGSYTFENDQFITNPPGAGTGLDVQPASCITVKNGIPTSSVTFINCVVQDFNIPLLPLCTADGVIVRFGNGQTTNIRGLSISEVPAVNFAGTFTIQDTFTYGGPVFVNPEPDTNYLVNVTPQSYETTAGAPAAGSNRPTFGLIKRQDGFSCPVEAAPGAGVTVTYGYTIIRNQRPPLIFQFLPTIPSTVANPLAGEVNAPWAVGVTLEPNGRNCFTLDLSTGRECIVEAGTVVNGTNWWEVALQNQSFQLSYGYGPGAIDANPRVVHGKLKSLLNPGSHNVGIFFDGVNIQPFMDGDIVALGSAATGTQQTPIYIGERFDASDTLTRAILHNFKFDNNYLNVLSNDNTIGPGLQDQAAFFGDDWVVGLASTSANGGFASQIAEASYGSGGTNTYYWMPTCFHGRLLTTPGNNDNLLTNFWELWQGPSTAPPLVALCILAGWYDIILGATGADVYAALLSVLEGQVAENDWNPPTSTTTPVDQHAFCEWVPPTTGSSTLVLPTHTFNISFNTSQHQTVLDAVALVNGNAPSAAVFTARPQLQGDGVSYALWLSVNVPGTAGNGLACSTNGANGSFMYGDIGGNFGGIALSVLTFTGRDTICTIAAIPFVANFDTNANTTIDNLVALVNADVTTSALVTASRVSGQMHVVANTAGHAGNDITVSSDPINTTGFGWDTEPSVRHLIGGFNGAIQNAIPNILLCNLPPIGTVNGVGAPEIAELNAANALINAYVGAGVTVVDVHTAMWNPGNHNNINPAYDTGGGLPGFPNDAGHTAMVALLDPLLP